jgi:putative peptidoglycan lipid II flippase
MIALIAGSATLGIAAQAGVLLLFWRRAGLKYRPEFRWRGVGLGKVGKAAGWTFAMILVSQLAGIVQSQVASLAGTDGITWAALRNAWLIFMLPHSIVTVSIVTAYFTRMSGHAHRGDTAALRRDVSSSLRTVGMIMVFATVALIAIAYPFAAVFAKGDFDATSALATVLIAFLVGLIPFTVLFILLRTFYALEDTRTPFFIQLVQAGLFVVGALLVALLPKDQIAIGIAVVTSIAGTVQTIVAAVVLRRRMGGLDGRRVIRSFLIYLLATIPAAIAGVALTAGFGAFDDGYAVSSIFAALLTMAVVGVVMLVLYVGVLAAFRNAELGDFVRPVVRRLRGRG